ncbi:hypothetical protein BRM9_1541 [Methanobacterium formicicum]|uniref:SMODS-associated and fused to various effectors domain-containing protein n=1 Tax=Methanobacterium formicicum TaxID=2162 RepID=A0A089ZGR7_METFO|nr:SAVED domain-containing protein [Methanobacterium formicicum]AIS32355.1 hypothetical protein BRM9_1541 [Methanobacterium formicicum]
MNRAINARDQGDDYQRLFFWFYALKMFYPHTGVEKVVYESDNVKSFDDIVVYYKEDKPCLDSAHNPINIDFFQVKFHVTNDNAFTWDGLMDPKLINAKSVSIMERLRNAQKTYNRNGVRFILVSPWTVNPNDNLSKIVSNRENEIRIDKLFDGRPRTKMAKMRQKMIKHLGISTDDELERILLPFRIWHSSFSSERLMELINFELLYLGFKPIENNSVLNPYLNLIKQWSLDGISEFTKEFIIEECKREGLYLGNKSSDSEYIDVGIRSFYRRAENMQDETEDMLCLLKFFNERYIKDDYFWNTDIFGEINDFTIKLIPENKYRLHLDTHLSIAFVAGYLLDSKSGINICPVQKTLIGIEDWCLEEDSNKGYTELKDEEIYLSKEKKDVALALGLTHDILHDVEEYIKDQEIDISKIIYCNVGGKSGHDVIKDAKHAKNLAGRVSTVLKERRDIKERRNKLHVFAACPVSFMFYLGKLSRSFGKVILYENDLEGNSDMMYSASFELP